MATVKLGVEDSEITLARVQVSRPTNVIKDSERKVMVDHSKRYAMYEAFKTWTLYFSHLVKAELDAIITEVERKQTLRFQDAWESNTWYTVVVVSFSYDFEHPATDYYTATLELEEV